MNQCALKFGCAVLALVVSISSWASGRQKPQTPPNPANNPDIIEKDGVEMVASQLLVSFESENAAFERSKIFKSLGGQEIERVGSTPLFLVQFPEDTDITVIKDKLEHMPGIRYAEPNLILKTLPVKPKK